jgi:hypothetical protein
MDVCDMVTLPDRECTIMQVRALKKNEKTSREEINEEEEENK